VCKKAGLRPAPVSSQIIQRDRHAEYFTTLALVAASIEKIAVEIRHLQRTEVAEAEEPFSEGQKGSSAMPHKRNPITSENLAGLSRILRANAFAALENVALWHERDISHSSVERIIAPDSTILLDYMLNRLIGLVDQLVVYPQAMKANLEKTGGLIFSEGLMLKLVQKGLSREAAYSLVQQGAFRSLQEKKNLLSIFLKDRQVLRYLNRKEIRSCFDLSHSLRHVGFIFQRIFGKRAR
jgi:adenylosuccinate lyase